MATDYRELYTRQLVTRYILHGDEGDRSYTDDIVNMFTKIAMMLVGKCEERLMEYVKQCQERLQEDKITPSDLENAVSFTEDAMMKIFRDKISTASETQRRGIHRRALRNCHDIIINNLTVTNVLSELIEEDIISIAEGQSINNGKSSRSQAQDLLSAIDGRVSLEQLNRVVLPIFNKNHPHIVDAIKSELQKIPFSEDEPRCLTCTVKQIVDVKKLAIPLYEGGAIDTALYNDLRRTGLSNRLKWEEVEIQVKDHRDVIKSLRSKYPDLYKELQISKLTTLDCYCEQKVISQSVTDDDVNVANLLELMDVTDENPENTEYKMTAVPCGICLIINNRDFKWSNTETQPGPTQREGTDVDVKRLKYIFGKFQFRIQVHENLTAAQLTALMEEVAGYDHAAYDCFACVILSHCSTGIVYGVDGEKVMTSILNAPFRATSCPSLAGKPKLFFIQGSQGKRRMLGFEMTGGNEDEKNKSVPDEADFLLGYSTVPGYHSYRSRSKGSWYVLKLSQVLEKFGESQDLLTCLRLVNSEIAKGNAKFGDDVHYKQVPYPVFTLTKRLRFNSDPIWSRSLSDEFV